jgi:MFS family permease
MQSIIPIGAAFGLIAINRISDTFGRKIAIILSQVAGIFGVGCNLQYI